jgi:hypothetical protein
MTPFLRLAVVLPLIFLALSSPTVPLFSQERQENSKKTGADLPDDDTFWFARQRAQAAAAAQMVLARNPYLVVALRLEGRRSVVWDEPEYFVDFAPALNSDWLASIRDEKPQLNFSGLPVSKISDDKMNEYFAYNEALVNSFNTPIDAFAKSAKENAHVVFAHLYNEPKKYRGKVIGIEGRLVRLRRWDAPKEAVKKNVLHVWEGWVFGRTQGIHPYCINIVMLPEGLREAEKLDQWVTFYGYFFKKMRYRSEDGKDRDTPLLVGPSVILQNPPGAAKAPDVASPLSVELLWTIIGFILGVAGLLIGLTWWYKRGDRRFQSQRARLQEQQAQEMISQAGTLGTESGQSPTPQETTQQHEPEP